MPITTWRLGGNDLRRVGYNITTTDGWAGIPARHQSNEELAYRHGEVNVSPKFFRSRDITLSMIVMGTDAAGLVTSSPLTHIQENLDLLLRWFGADGPQTLSKTMSDGSTRTCEIEVLDGFSVDAGVGITRQFVAVCKMTYPFWHQTPIVNANGKTGTTTITNNGNSPIQDAVIEFTASGRLTNSDNGDWIEVSSVAGGNVIVDLSAWTIKQAGADADKLLTYNNPWLMRFNPGVNNLSITATVDIDYYHSWF